MGRDLAGSEDVAKLAKGVELEEMTALAGGIEAEEGNGWDKICVVGEEVIFGQLSTKLKGEMGRAMMTMDGQRSVAEA
ncbi:hypothetical protein HK101_002108, partial [Irineochytrium annulatum]